MPEVEQDLLTTPEHLRLPPVFGWGSCCLVFRFLCCVLYTIICLFAFLFFSHGVVSLFSIFEFDCSSVIFRPSFIIIRSQIVILCKYIIFKKGIILSFLPSFLPPSPFIHSFLYSFIHFLLADLIFFSYLQNRWK